MAKIVIFKTMTETEMWRFFKEHSNKRTTADDYCKFLVNNDDGTFTTVDNTTGNCLTSEFRTRPEAIEYLIKGKDEEDE